jgi:oxygen-independent coproporphyrinogen III oxidase
MAFGVYVHIPYCLQRCVYCDFATYETSQILPPNEYVERVKKEIELRAPEVGPKPLDTLYFGGGTPSLLPPELLIDIVQTLNRCGFPLKKNAEVTLEINPATLNESHIKTLLSAGFNRFSVGAQSFDDALLKKAHRRHSAQDTRDTLSLLKSLGVNLSLDVLFALPTQPLEQVGRDVDEALRFDPPHVSPYCLTVPEGHPFSTGRAPDEEQIEMFDVIEKKLIEGGLHRYEISNFAKPGFESRHNLLYWNDDEYWGVGLSSHSYLHRFDWGVRFWNPRNINEYVSAIDKLSGGDWRLAKLRSEEGERLLRHQALTDFMHISLRKSEGLDRARFEKKFGTQLETVAAAEIERLKEDGLITEVGQNITLSAKGLLLSNKVFEAFTFLAS